jgi:hypothetical protein
MKTFFKILIAIVFMVLVVLIIFFITKNPSKTTPVQQGTTTQTSTPSPVSPLPVTNAHTFTDTVHKVTYDYPTEMTLSQNGTLNGTTGILISSAELSSSFEPKTNFRGANFIVGSSNDATSIAQCSNPQNGEHALGTTLINGVFFSKFSLNDAGAGNFYDTTSYRTIYNNQCYVIQYTIHTTNISNYDPSQGISEYSKASVIALLESVAQSFKFLK